MKHILSIIILLLAFITSLFAQERDEILKIWKNPKPYLEAIRNDIKNRDLSWEGDKTLGNRIQGLAFAINQEIIYAESKDWTNPSSDRVKVIDKWGKILEPYTKELLVLVMEETKTRERSSTQARSILDFASPTEQFEQDVRHYMTESSPKTAHAAAHLLYEHRLLNLDDINILKNIIHSSDRPGKTPLALMSLSFYGMTDGIKSAQEILRSKPNSNDYLGLITQYRDALELMQNLGPAAESLLPDLDALIKKIDASQLGEFKSGLLTKFQYAHDIVTGKEPMQVRVAKNGSGFLPLKVGDLPESTNQRENPRKDTSHYRPEKSRSSADSKSPNTIEKKTVTFPWAIIASFIGLLVIALAACLKMRKSKSTS